MAMCRLHSFCQSGPSFKVAFVLRAMNQPWEPVLVDSMNRSGSSVLACVLTHFERAPHGCKPH